MNFGFSFLIIFGFILHIAHSSWEEWWTYAGISGPGFWGLINPKWFLCNKGKRQSPINIDADKLLFDPSLQPIDIGKEKVEGTLKNTGQSLIFQVDEDSKDRVIISGGPLTYTYQFEKMYFHYGLRSKEGSEHKIRDFAYPVEIQLYGFNKDLYQNMSEAEEKPHGLVGISLMLKIGENSTNALKKIAESFDKVIYRGSSAKIHHLSLKSLLHHTEHYITYDGSTSYPGCNENVVWMILNKPMNITIKEFYDLGKIMQGSEQMPIAQLANNFKPIQPLNHRTIRTNINSSENMRIQHAPLVYEFTGNSTEEIIKLKNGNDESINES